ncbi:MAG: tryptophan synthase subunit alpha [Polyangiales bacterium]
MSRFAPLFAQGRADRRALLIPYFCAGFPDLQTTVELVCAAADAGADIVELGVPFSDPTADGPAIQRASEHALAGGTTLRQVLQAVRSIRQRSDVPLLLFGYYNPILAFGEGQTVEAAAAAGIDGLLVVDLPPEESAGLRQAAVAAALDYVPLVAPNTQPHRIVRITAQATSFLYSVSLTGVTGARRVDLHAAAQRCAALRQQTGHPVAVGFGIQSEQDVATIAAQADAVIVGSALVRLIESTATPQAAPKAVHDCLRAWREATTRSSSATAG